jgi:hypothetical protein
MTNVNFIYFIVIGGLILSEVAYFWFLYKFRIEKDELIAVKVVAVFCGFFVTAFLSFIAWCYTNYSYETSIGIGLLVGVGLFIGINLWLGGKVLDRRLKKTKNKKKK